MVLALVTSMRSYMHLLLIVWQGNGLSMTVIRSDIYFLESDFKYCLMLIWFVNDLIWNDAITCSFPSYAMISMNATCWMELENKLKSATSIILGKQTNKKSGVDTTEKLLTTVLTQDLYKWWIQKCYSKHQLKICACFFPKKNLYYYGLWKPWNFSNINIFE